MPGKSPAERAALQEQGERLIGLFEAAGFAQIAPDILQPADLFLDRSGENIRARTFVFTDPSGSELCLRPDLTVPACRYHLSHAPKPDAEARYCYIGPAFRHQPEGGSTPAEFEQAGVEWYADRDAAAADAETLKLALDAVEAAGLRGYTVRLGDLGLFDALLRSIPMPERWRRRLKHQFWRPAAFHALLETLTAGRAKPRTSISGLIDDIAAHGPDSARARVSHELDARGLALLGGRTVEEIAERLMEKAADRGEPRLAPEAARTIDAYLAISGAPREAIAELTGLARDIGDPFATAAEAFAKRMRRLEALSVDTGNFTFSGGFGRTLEYYTGLIFQIEVARPGGAPSVIAGGGRYDGLLSDMGSPSAVTAVGFALYTERLLAAVRSDA